jgi:hypothetical protein
MIGRVGLGLCLVLSGCSNGAASSSTDGLPVCDVSFAAPTGFAPIETFEDPYRDHVGVRLGFEDPEGRQFHVLSGIPGEIGEGLPAAGSVALSGARTAELVGRDDVWVMVWDEGDVCDPRAVIGDGFTRPEFEELLGQAGLT